MDKKITISRAQSALGTCGPHAIDRRGRAAPAPAFRFDCSHLIERGFAGFACPTADLMVIFRGTGMIDVFGCGDWRHVAFLDFDLRRDVHLDSAFGSPLIGLPFPAAFRQAQGIDLMGFDDLRRQHHYGFFVEAAYRNKGGKGIWNLDELMMAVALEYADANQYAWFSIKPTGDTAEYYTRKFGAVRPLPTKIESVLHIPLGSARKPLPHVRPIRDAGHNRYLDVDLAADPGD